MGTPEFDKDLVPEPPEWWANRVRRKVDAFMAEKRFDGMNTKQLIDNLRQMTLVGMNQLAAAALEEGHPDFMLRVGTQAARITGLTTPDVSIQIGSGNAESLPDLSHLSDEELARLSGGAIETTAQPVEESNGESPKPKRRRAKAIGHIQRPLED